MAAEALWVACRQCRVPFDTGLRMDRRSFQRGTLAANYHTCPRCGARETYRKVDYELRRAMPGERRQELCPQRHAVEPAPEGAAAPSKEAYMQ